MLFGKKQTKTKIEYVIGEKDMRADIKFSPGELGRQQPACVSLLFTIPPGKLDFSRRTKGKKNSRIGNGIRCESAELS